MCVVVVVESNLNTPATTQTARRTFSLPNKLQKLQNQTTLVQVKSITPYQRMPLWLDLNFIRKTTHINHPYLRDTLSRCENNVFSPLSICFDFYCLLHLGSNDSKYMQKISETCTVTQWWSHSQRICLFVFLLTWINLWNILQLILFHMHILSAIIFQDWTFHLLRWTVKC